MLTQCILCVGLCVFATVQERHKDMTVIYFTWLKSVKAEMCFHLSKGRNTSRSMPSICYNLKKSPEQCRRLDQPYVLSFRFKFLLSLWICFINKGFHCSLRGYILEQGRPKMAPTTTGPEAGSSSTHTASHSDLGEKQPFKQVACLSAGGECQPLVLP